MSRIGNQPIELPKGVDIQIEGSGVTVKGPRGQLSDSFNSDIACLLYTSPSPRDGLLSRMPSSA